MRKKKLLAPKKRPAPAATTVSTISVLLQILEQAKLTNVLLNRSQATLEGISEKVTLSNEIALASQQHLTDIDIELSAQGEELEEQGKTLTEILEAIQGPFQPTTGSTLTQTSGDSMPGPYSILAGGTGTFLRSDLPSGSGGLATGTFPTYVPSNSAVVVGPDPNDPSNPDAFSLTSPAGDPETSFVLDVTITPAVDATGAPGTPVTDSFTIMVVQVPPPFVPTTNSDLTQTSGVPGKVARARRR